jgi:chromosome segregation ATPase
VSRHETELAQKQQTVNDLRTQNDSVNVQLGQDGDIIEDFTNQIHALEGDKEALEAELQEKTNALDIEKDTSRRLNEVIAQLRQEFESKVQNLVQMNETLEERDQEIAHLKGHEQEQVKIISRLTTNARKGREVVAQVKSATKDSGSVDSLIASNESKEAEIKRLEGLNARLEHQLNQQKLEIRNKDTLVRQYSESVKERVEEINRLKRELDVLKAKLKQGDEG